jgi:hypothetical protein
MFVRLAQIIIILVPLTVFGWLAEKELVVSGVFTIEHAVGEASPFIDRLLPDARVSAPHWDEDGDEVQTVSDDPVFFFVHPHRGFDQVEAEVWFKNYGNPIVELGGLAQVAPEVYDLQPLQNTIIDELAWPKLEKDGVILLQKDPKYATIEDFLAAPPPRHEIATYHFELAKPYLIAGYTPSGQTRTIDVSLRGVHIFKTYIKNELLDFQIQLMDMNREEGADPVRAVVYAADGAPVAEAALPDDGNASQDGNPAASRTLDLRAAGLPEGVYKIELSCGRDIFFRRMTTTQQKIVFLNGVYLADESGYQPAPRGVAFWTEGKNFSWQTQHASGAQTVQMGSASVAIAAPYENYRALVKESGVVRVDVPRGDIMVSLNGHIAFAPDQFFNPDPIRLDPDTDLAKLNVQYLIARYTPPRQAGKWTVARAVFTAKLLTYVAPGTWKFVFSVPGIRENQTTLDVGRTDWMMRREPFSWHDLFRFIKL